LPKHQAGTAVPVHVAVIMDGNGRWAKRNGLPRTEGHRRGLETAKRIVKCAEDLGIRFLSLFSFSTENWKRAEDEVNYLMFLIRDHLMKELDFYRQNEIRVVHSGDIEGLPPDVRDEIRRVTLDTAVFSKLTVNLAINYGGRNEIVRACNRAVRAASERGETDRGVDERAISSCLDHPELPDPDLLIRTAGELRISNFLLWQAAYAELYFSEKYWPDWTEDDLREAVAAFSARDRRFGGAP
jgi:undecaprenyl diphosphate synthase